MQQRVELAHLEIIQLYESASKETMFKLIKLIEEITHNKKMTLLKLLNFKLYLTIISIVTGGQVTDWTDALDIFVFLNSSCIIAFLLFSCM